MDAGGFEMHPLLAHFLAAACIAASRSCVRLLGVPFQTGEVIRGVTFLRRSEEIGGDGVRVS